MNNIKIWYTSKTIWIAILQGIAGVIVAVATTYDGLGYLIIVKSVIDVVLRTITEQPIK